jgi:YggT family protein
MCALFALVLLVLNIYSWVLVAAAVMSWLHAFGVINRYNKAVATIEDVLFRLTDPLLRPLRRYIPSAGGLDLSFIVLYLLVYFLQIFIRDDLGSAVSCVRYY